MLTFVVFCRNAENALVSHLKISYFAISKGWFSLFLKFTHVLYFSKRTQHFNDWHLRRFQNYILLSSCFCLPPNVTRQSNGHKVSASLLLDFHSQNFRITFCSGSSSDVNFVKWVRERSILPHEHFRQLFHFPNHKHGYVNEDSHMRRS